MLILPKIREKLFIEHMFIIIIDVLIININLFTLMTTEEFIISFLLDTHKFIYMLLRNIEDHYLLDIWKQNIFQKEAII